jgi:hypothetical protein
MAKKKQRISKIELFIWKLTGILLAFAWIVAIIFITYLLNQYSWGDLGVGFIVFYILLILLPASYLILSASIARLRPQGFKYALSMSALILGFLPLVFLSASFISMTNSVDPISTFAIVALAVGFAVFILINKTIPR